MWKSKSERFEIVASATRDIHNKSGIPIHLRSVKKYVIGWEGVEPHRPQLSVTDHESIEGVQTLGILMCPLEYVGLGVVCVLEDTFASVFRVLVLGYSEEFGHFDE